MTGEQIKGILLLQDYYICKVESEIYQARCKVQWEMTY